MRTNHPNEGADKLGPRQPKPLPAIRVKRDNRNHHLWNNNGTWWCHYTVHLPDYTKHRVRVSLGTYCLTLARFLRDSLFFELGIGPHAEEEDPPETALIAA